MPGSLPTPSDDAERRVVDDIRKHGWQVVLVRGGAGEQGETWSAHPPSQAAYEAEFTYSAGLTTTFGHPEVVLVGAWQAAHPLVNAVGELVGRGARFTPGDTSDDVLPGFRVRFGGVSDRCRKDLLTWAAWVVERRPFEALQLVLPDTEGRWPEEPGYTGFPQPALLD